MNNRDDIPVQEDEVMILQRGDAFYSTEKIRQVNAERKNRIHLCLRRGMVGGNGVYDIRWEHPCR